MTSNAREMIADAAEVGIDSVHDMDVTLRGYAEGAADAILSAMPAIIAGMVKPLEWDKNPDNQEWYCKLPEVAGQPYERGYMILPARSHFTLYVGFAALARVAGHFTMVSDAIEAANAHHRATILADLGVKQ